MDSLQDLDHLGTEFLQGIQKQQRVLCTLKVFQKLCIVSWIGFKILAQFNFDITLGLHGFDESLLHKSGEHLQSTRSVPFSSFKIFSISALVERFSYIVLMNLSSVDEEMKVDVSGKSKESTWKSASIPVIESA
jgi:hypothetical protein